MALCNCGSIVGGCGGCETVAKATFGEPDPANTTTQKLDNLRMLDHYHITKYNVAFYEYLDITVSANTELKPGVLPASSLHSYSPGRMWLHC